MKDNYAYEDFLESTGCVLEDGLWTIELVDILKRYSFRYCYSLVFLVIGACSAQIILIPRVPNTITLTFIRYKLPLKEEGNLIV